MSLMPCGPCVLGPGVASVTLACSHTHPVSQSQGPTCYESERARGWITCARHACLTPGTHTRIMHVIVHGGAFPQQRVACIVNCGRQALMLC